MPPVVKYASMLLLAVLLCSCAAVQVPGETKADPALKRSVTGLLKQIELGYHCSTLRLRVTDTKIIVPFDGKKGQEKWVVLSCNGETHLYEVNYMASPGGGTDFGIRKWPKEE
jgi:hypothetical protein